MPAELKSTSHGLTMVLTISNPDNRNALSAVLVDFKTGPAAPSAGKAALQYRRQIGIYRQALERLLALPAAKIRAVLIFTASREAVDL